MPLVQRPIRVNQGLGLCLPLGEIPETKSSPLLPAPCYGSLMTRAKARLPLGPLTFPVVLPLAVPLAMLASACSSPGNYPSLALRDVERASGSAKPVSGEPAAPAAPLPPASADLATRLDGLVAAAREANQQFQSNRPAAERAVAAAGDTGSDSWSTASVALARLESSRSSAMVALGDLDTLYVEARTAGALEETPSAKAIAAARDEVDGWVASQNAIIAALSARLPG